LKSSQNLVVNNYRATLLNGIKGGTLNTEDGIPHKEVMGVFTKENTLDSIL